MGYIILPVIGFSASRRKARVLYHFITVIFY